MVSGETGLNGLSVPRAVVEEQRPVGDSVTVQPRPTVVENAMVATLSREGVTLNNVLTQVKKNNLWKARKAFLFS